MSLVQKDWWGFSQEHGWVVVDTDDPRNVSGSSTVHLFRCSDGTEITISRDDWEPPTTVFAPKYLSSLTNEELRAFSERQLLEFRSQYSVIKKDRIERIKLDLSEKDQRRKQERDEKIRTRHEEFLRLKGLPARKTVTLKQAVRYTKCRGCPTHINSADDLGCEGCRGIICHECGACLCGWSG